MDIVMKLGWGVLMIGAGGCFRGMLARGGRRVLLAMLCVAFVGSASVQAGEMDKAQSAERASGFADPRLSVHFFRAEGCPHCEEAGVFLQRYAGDERIAIHRYEIQHDPAARQDFARIVDALELSEAGVPLVVIGDWAVIGFHGDDSSGAAIHAQLTRCLAQACSDSGAAIIAGRQPSPPLRLAETVQVLPKTLRLPLIGEVNPAALSLPALTVLLGALDGFNPCAMWALVFLLGLLMGARDRRRMWLLGLTFLFGSSLVVFMIMASWLNVLLAVGYLGWLRVAVGIVALAAAAWQLHDYFTNPEAACRVGHGDERRPWLARLRRYALDERLWPALGGVFLLALAVNLIELVCSAGIPAVYTQVLALSALTRWQYYGYLLLYNLVFMLDDILLFVVAASTLQLTGFGARYARGSRLIGGVVIGVIGVLLLFRPQWLAFH